LNDFLGGEGGAKYEERKNGVQKHKKITNFQIQGGECPPLLPPPSPNDVLGFHSSKYINCDVCVYNILIVTSVYNTLITTYVSIWCRLYNNTIDNDVTNDVCVD